MVIDGATNLGKDVLQFVDGWNQAVTQRLGGAGIVVYHVVCIVYQIADLSFGWGKLQNKMFLMVMELLLDAVYCWCMCNPILCNPILCNSICIQLQTSKQYNYSTS